MESNRYSLPAHVRTALSLLTRSGFEAYAVGGAVRDLLRGVPPHDYDLTTSATPEEMKRVFAGYRTIETGIAHGTLTVLIDGEPLEVTTYRLDGSYTDARHPDGVVFTRSLREDVARRDFTVNAMAYRPEEGLADLFGGQDDLKAQLIRCVGEPVRRFTEDALRILRALRFAAVLDFTIEETTARAAHDLRERLRYVSPERVREEFVKLLCGKGASRVLREFSDVIEVFIPEIAPMRGFDQKNAHHDYDVWEHTLHALEAIAAEPSLRLAVFFHDFGKPATFFTDEAGVGHFYGHAEESARIADAVMRRLRFDTATRERVVLLVKLHDLVPVPDSRQFARLRSRHGDEFLPLWLAIVRADRMGQKKIFSAEAEATVAAAEDAAARILAEETRMSLSSLALRGEDLIAHGVPVGPAIGAALGAALEAVLSGDAENEKDALLAFLKKEGHLGTPIECERKLLIRMPDDAFLAQAEGSEITQTYLRAEAGITARVRRRVYPEKTVYTHTEKRRLSALSAIEKERQISKEEYEVLLTQADTARRPIEKTRYTVPYEGHLLEIDVYPFWQRQAVLEIELASEKEAFSLPPFLTVLREVTAERAYKNVSLSKDIPPED